MIRKLVLYENFLDDKSIKMFLEYEKNKTDDNLSALSRALIEDEELNRDMWKKHIMKLVMNSLNQFSLYAEKNNQISNDYVKKIIKNDLKIIRRLLLFDPYRSKHIMSQIEKAIMEEKYEKATYLLCNAYYNEGAGILHKSKAYMWENGIKNVYKTDDIKFDDLIGYEYQKDRIIKNTEAFIKGKPYNNLLLFGDKGTGKSSMVKAVFNKYKDQRLRICEMNKNNLEMINDVMEYLGKRGFKFILFLDDLSFEENEYEYKALKAHIEGGLKVQPDNVAIYATTNRKHIVKESIKDNVDITDELHLSDAIQEKLSLSDRFGITITFPTPNQKEYINIIKGIKDKYNVEMDDEKLRILANRWALSYHGKSGRSAKQFIDSIRGGVFSD